MDNLHALVSGISDGMLGEIIKRLLNDNNIKVLENSSDLDQLIDVVTDGVDYLIIGVENNKLPNKYKEIFNLNKNLAVIELLDNGRCVAFFMDDVNEAILNKIINLKVR